MTLPELIYDVKTIIQSGKLSDDSIYDSRLITYWLNTQRALWLNNEYNKGRYVRNNEVQVLFNVEMQVINADETTGLNLGGQLVRSVNPLPRNIEIHSRDLITAVRSVDMIYRKAINYVSRDQAVFSGNGMMNRNELFAFKVNDYLYLKYGEQSQRDQIPLHLRVEGVFENPLEVDEFNGTLDQIWNGITQYPISAKFVDYIKGAIMQGNVIPMIKFPRDTQNNEETSKVQ